jgi:CheY-like chemotaxis protein
MRTACVLCLCLCLQDLMMPEVDGLDILRYVRGNILLSDLPVISE